MQGLVQQTGRKGEAGVGETSLELRKAQGRQTWGQLQGSSGRQMTNAEDESERGERKFRILALG